MSEAQDGDRRGERGSGAVRVSAAAASAITGLVISFSVVVGPTSPGHAPVHDAGQAEPDLGTPVAPLPDPESAPLETSQVGETRQGPNSDTTLLQVRQVPAPADRSAPAGQEWYGIRARTCMHTDAEPSGDVLWSDWVVVTEPGNRYAGRSVPWDDFPPEQYDVAGLGPGECTAGWVLVPVPRGTFRLVVQVTFRPSSPEPLEWAV